MFGGKAHGVEVSQVCTWVVTGDIHWVCIPWEYTGQDELSSSAVALTPCQVSTQGIK